MCASLQPVNQYSHYYSRPKNYVIGVEDEKTGEVKSDVKCRGFFLSGFKAKKELNVDTYREFIKALEEGDTEKKKLIPQFQINYHPKARKMYSKFGLKRFSNGYFEKRIIVVKEGHCIMTLPYGFNAQLLQEVEKNMKPLKKNKINN